MQYTHCYVGNNEYPHRFLGKIEEPTDCMKDACYWTYPVEQLDIFIIKIIVVSLKNISYMKVIYALQMKLRILR